MIALVDGSSVDAVDDALLKAGAVRTIHTEIGQ